MLEMIGDVAWPTTNDTGPTNPQDAETLRLCLSSKCSSKKKDAQSRVDAPTEEKTEV